MTLGRLYALQMKDELGPKRIKMQND